VRYDDGPQAVQHTVFPATLGRECQRSLEEQMKKLSILILQSEMTVHPEEVLRNSRDSAEVMG